KRIKQRVAAQMPQSMFARDINQPRGAFFVRTFPPPEGFVEVPEGFMNESHFIRRDVLGARGGHESIEAGERGLAMAASGLSLRQTAEHHMRAVCQFHTAGNL